MNRFLLGVAMIGMGLGGLGAPGVWINVLALVFMATGVLLAYSAINALPHPEDDRDG